MSMTLEKAIKILSELHDQCCQADSIFCTDTTGARCEAVDMAISALRAQDLQPTCNNLATDTISRQAEIDALDCINGTEEVLRSLPSAQPEPSIPISWLEKEISWLKNMDNGFSNIAAMNISVLVKKWRKENAKDNRQTAQSEIIRCKDCKFYSPMNRETKTGICNLTMHQNFGDNWFCAGAKRRTDECTD